MSREFAQKILGLFGQLFGEDLGAFEIEVARKFQRLGKVASAKCMCFPGRNPFAHPRK